jgi:DNA-binding transcriptional LysR family regulator
MDTWLGVEVRHLAALSAVHEERSFRGAADRLGYVQSAVSQQISHLERLVGIRLVERTRGHAGVDITEAGRLLLVHAERILAELGAAEADLRALSSGASGTLRVGTYESVATRLVPQALTLLAERRPEIDVVTTEAAWDADLFEKVERGELDVAFAERPLDPGPFDSIELMVDPPVLLVQAESPLARKEGPATLADIASLPLIAHPAWRMFPLIEAEFRATGLDPEFRLGSNSNAAMQALVGAGLGSAILPRLAADPHDPAIDLIDLSGMLPARTLALFWHADRHLGDALDAFCDAVLDACARLPWAAPAPSGAGPDTPASSNGSPGFRPRP